MLILFILTVILYSPPHLDLWVEKKIVMILSVGKMNHWLIDWLIDWSLKQNGVRIRFSKKLVICISHQIWWLLHEYQEAPPPSLPRENRVKSFPFFSLIVLIKNKAIMKSTSENILPLAKFYFLVLPPFKRALDCIYLRYTFRSAVTHIRTRFIYINTVKSSVDTLYLNTSY